MALLLYKSNEMFSSTELIRKSKMIFEKILQKDIEKAIILRDGKPSFLLMEFAKYEKIMAEYEELKEYVQNVENGTIPKKVKVKNKKKIKPKSQEDQDLKKELVEKSKQIELPKVDYADDKETTIQPQVESEDDPTTKEEIKQKILQARKEREKLTQSEQVEDEINLDEQILEEKRKKEQELEEFWD